MLDARGILYFRKAVPVPGLSPDSGAMSGRALSSIFERVGQGGMPPKVRRLFGTREALHAWAASNWEQFEAEVRDLKPEITVITSEHFSALREPLELIERLRQSFDRIDVIAYVRDAASLLPSRLDQTLRSGGKHRALIAGKGMAYPMGRVDVLRLYAEVVGPDALHIRNFAAANLRNGDVADDFFQTLRDITGGDVPFDARPDRHNESSPGALSAWLMMQDIVTERGRKGPLEPAEWKQRMSLLSMLRAAPELRDLPKLKLEDRRLEAYVCRAASEDAAWLNSTFLQDQVLLAVPDEEEVTLRPEEALQAMEAWVMGYYTPEIAAQINELILQHRWEDMLAPKGPSDQTEAAE